MWNITTKINFSQPGGVNVILQTVRQIDATQNKAVPDDPYARLFKAAPSCYRVLANKIHGHFQVFKCVLGIFQGYFSIFQGYFPIFQVYFPNKKHFTGIHKEVN